MKKITFISYIIFLLLIPIVLGDYIHLGGQERDYYTEQSTWNNETNETIYAASPFTPWEYPPLMTDWDLDGEVELIHFAHPFIYVYSLPDLDLEVAISLKINPANTDFYVMSVDTWDFNDDGYTDLTLMYGDNDTAGGQNLVVEIVSYNGTDIFREDILITLSSDTTDGLIMCDDTYDRCLVVTEGDGTETNSELRWQAFNESFDLGSSVQIEFDAGGDKIWCLPAIRQGAVGDYDADSDIEFIISHMRIEDGGTERLYIKAASVDSTLTVTEEAEATHDITDLFLSGTGETCRGSNYGHLLSPPLLIDTDGDSKLEIVVSAAHNEDGNEFDYHLYKFSSSFVFDDEYPEDLLDGSAPDGQTTSNVFRSNWENNDDQDYCAAYFSAEDNDMSVMCADKTGFAGLGQHEIYDMDNQDFNITLDEFTYSQLVHSSESVIGGFHEFMTTYGMLEITGSDLRNVYDPNLDEPTILMYDFDENADADFSAWDGASIYFYTSSRAEYQCGANTGEILNTCYSNIGVRCSTEEVWLENNSVEVRVTTQDFQDANVAARVIIYANHSNSQNSGWSEYSPAGTTILILGSAESAFNANVTGNGFRMLIELRNDVQPVTHETVELSFSVSNTVGISYEDCSLQNIIGDTTLDEDIFEDIGLDENDNIVVNTARDIQGYTNLPIAIMWLFVGLFIAIMMPFEMGLKVESLAYGAGAFMVWMILGIMFGFVSILWLIIPVLLALAVLILLGLFIRNRSGGV